MSCARFILMGGLSALLLSGCATSGQNSCGSPTEQKLSYGVLSYEEGDYRASTTALQGALNGGLIRTSDRVRAHKYLAFIHCVSAQEEMCRNDFRKALEIDPDFNLEPAEAGHPIWGPVFRSVKSR